MHGMAWHACHKLTDATSVCSSIALAHLVSLQITTLLKNLRGAPPTLAATLARNSTYPFQCSQCLLLFFSADSSLSDYSCALLFILAAFAESISLTPSFFLPFFFRLFFSFYMLRRLAIMLQPDQRSCSNEDSARSVSGLSHTSYSRL